MALYLGSDKVKINLNNAKYYLNLYTVIPIIDGVKLLSIDNYILRDINGLYITAKESE